MPRTLGVCSWSLHPESPKDLVAQVKTCGIDSIQLHIDPLRTGKWPEADCVKLFKEGGIKVVSGMMGTRGEDYTTLETIKNTGGVRLDQYWDENLAAAKGNAALAQRLGIPLVTFHAGFIPHDHSDPVHKVMISRLQQMADAFADKGVKVAFETGQENADTLLVALKDINRKTVGVNFDPANMILYGMGDPVDALNKLASHVMQIHVKDANPAKTPGTWGEEKKAGAGTVDWPAFFNVLNDKCPGVPLIIEREAGPTRVNDVIEARELVKKLAK